MEKFSSISFYIFVLLFPSVINCNQQTVCINNEAANNADSCSGSFPSFNSIFAPNEGVNETELNATIEKLVQETLTSFQLRIQHLNNITNFLEKKLSELKDVNECEDYNGNCSHTCINSIGSYHCKCPPNGFVLGEDNRTCIDVNECEDNNGNCSHICNNSIGSYHCECPSNSFVLGRDNKTCSDVDECKNNNGGCSHTCNNSIGSYHCECPSNGFVLGQDNRTCTDADECEYNNGGCSYKCNNSIGSYHCECPSNGFVLKKDNRTCIDVNECEDYNGNCSHTCINSIGSYHCECPSNSFVLGEDNKTCIDLDECKENNGGCSQMCRNLIGGYQCSCSSIGFVLGNNNRTCIDVNECEDNNGGCSHTCLNSIGSYHCECPPNAFILGGDKRTCIEFISSFGNFVTSNIQNWYNYKYDGSPTSAYGTINDGGDDMYDGGNMVNVYLNNKKIISAQYNQTYRFDNFVFEVFASHPFIALLTVYQSKDFVNYTIQVTGDAGADGTMGNISHHSGNISHINGWELRYYTFQISGAVKPPYGMNNNDPSICEVYFMIYQNGVSSIPDSFQLNILSYNTNRPNNIASMTGRPKHVTMGYMLLSKARGELVNESEVRLVLTRFLSYFA